MWKKKYQNKWLDPKIIFSEMKKWNPEASTEFKAHLLTSKYVSNTDLRAMIKSDNKLWDYITKDNIQLMALSPKEWTHFIAREKPNNLDKDTIEFVIEELSVMLLSGKVKTTIPLKKSLEQIRTKYNVS